MECQNINMGRITYEHLFYFLSWDNVLDHRAIEYHTWFYSCSLFLKKAIIIAINGQETLHWQLSKAIISGMYNCNFEAINQVLNKRMKKLQMEYGPFIYTIIFYLMLCINSSSNSNSKQYILCHDFTKKYVLQCLVLIIPSKQILCSKPAKALGGTEICLFGIFWKNHVWKDDFYGQTFYKSRPLLGRSFILFGWKKHCEIQCFWSFWIFQSVGK